MPSASAPAGPLTLRDALARALLHNPDLAVFAWEMRAREARVLQAGRPPNPVMGVLFEDIGASGRPVSGDPSVQAQASLQLSQLVELGGKRAARQTVAARDRDLAWWDYEAARIDTLTNVTRAFVDAAAAERSVVLAEQISQLVEDVRQRVAARVEAGDVSPIEATKAGVAAAATRLEMERSRRSLEAARLRLSALLGDPSPSFDRLEGDLESLPDVPTLDQLRERVRQTPELARWTAEIAQREAVLALEKSRRVPDVNVTAGYRRFLSIDSNAWIVGASVPLPLFDRNTAAIAEAASRVAGARGQQRATELRVGSALAEAHRALATAQAELAVLRAVIIPGARETFDAVTEGYRLGRFGYLEVLDAQRTLITGNTQYLRALSDFHKAVAEVERLTGAPVSGPGQAPLDNE